MDSDKNEFQLVDIRDEYEYDICCDEDVNYGDYDSLSVLVASDMSADQLILLNG